jgi:hypothetical protein
MLRHAPHTAGCLGSCALALFLASCGTPPEREPLDKTKYFPLATESILTDVPRGAIVGFLDDRALDPEVWQPLGRGKPRSYSAKREADGCDIPKDSAFVLDVDTSTTEWTPDDVDRDFYQICFASAHQPKGLTFAYPRDLAPLDKPYRKVKAGDLKELRWFKRTDAPVSDAIYGVSGPRAPGYASVEEAPVKWEVVRSSDRWGKIYRGLGEGHGGDGATIAKPTRWLRATLAGEFPTGAVVGWEPGNEPDFVPIGFRETSEPSCWMRTFRRALHVPDGWTPPPAASSRPTSGPSSRATSGPTSRATSAPTSRPR